MRVTFNRLAELELNEAVHYYQLEESGLGTAFLAEVRRTVEAILESPHTGPIVMGSVRRRLCHRFPYSLLYDIRNDEIRILAVMNQRRRPNTWIGRS